ncbi:MAG: uracil-DNA glycosylase family protein [Myxococcaceae bacterium]
MAANPSELFEVIADLQRHLAWQESDTGAVILAEAGALKSSPVPPAARVMAPPNRAPETPSRAAPSPSRPAESTLNRTPPASPAARLSSAARPLASEPAPVRKPSVPGARAKSVADLAPITGYSEADRRPLDEIKRELGECTRCKLCSGRKQIVFGVGNPRAKLVFVGEGPGAEEDAQGIPFVGPAGQLLTKMIEAMGFGRDEVYICNVVKCRPPDNRTPEIDEIEACEPFLRAQLGALQPQVIVALGKTAAQTLLREELPITKIRGTWREYAGIPVMPTFHPSYLLRKPDEKKNSWSDLQQVMKVFGKEPKRS